MRRDIYRDMKFLSLYIIGKTLFGEDTQGEPDSIGHTLHRMLDLVTHPGLSFIAYDLPGLPYRRLLDQAAYAEGRIRQLIAAKRGKGHTNALAMLLDAQDQDGTALTDDEIVGHVGLMFVAGYETTAAALSWTLLLIAQHPQIAASLHEELAGVLKGDAPQIENLGKLQLLDRVIKESLRLIPPAPLNHRILETETSLGGYVIPPHTELFVSIYHIHHDKDIFPEPQRFLPDRWLTANPGPFEYNPFGAGPRMCLGAPFVMLELKLVLAMLLQRYRLEPIPGLPIDRRVLITISPRNGLPMIVRCPDGHFDRGVGGLRGNIRECMELPT
jgi:cytochrome P450